MKTIIFYNRLMQISASEERAMKILKSYSFAATKSAFAEGSGKHIDTVLPKDRNKRNELGIYEIYPDGVSGSGYVNIAREKRFFKTHPRCKSGVFGDPRRINAILKRL